MDLQCLSAHMKSKAVLVNGTIYKIDERGVALGVSDEDAKKLLANASGAWKPVVKRQPLGAAKPVAPVPTPEPQPEPPAPVVVEPVEEEDRGEWPDPTEDMEIETLREIADAYEVPYRKNTSKKKLVADISAAMYPEDEE